MLDLSRKMTLETFRAVRPVGLTALFGRFMARTCAARSL
jgi:hypothetical protein